MPKCVPLVSVDIDAQIRKLLLEKQPVRHIVKTLSVSSKRVCRVRLELLNGDTINKTVVSKRDKAANGNIGSKENTHTPEDIENLRKEVEYKALNQLRDCLDNGYVEVKDINGILAQVGEKPKQQGDTVVMLINSVGNMAVAARQLLINEAKAKQIPAPDIIDVVPDDATSQIDTE